MHMSKASNESSTVKARVFFARGPWSFDKSTTEMDATHFANVPQALWRAHNAQDKKASITTRS
jgi:hypothetical protein